MAANDTQIRLQECLQVLVGLPLSIARNAANMKVLHFGTIRPHHSGKGTVGAYAIHIQCPWRITAENNIVTGSSDRFVEPYEGAEIDEENPRSGNLQFVKIANLLKGYDDVTSSFVNATEELVVTAVNSDKYGGADLSLSGGYHLQIFPDCSLEEDWRFIDVEGDQDHVVIAGGKVEIDES